MIAAAVIALVALPLLALRRRTLAAYCGVDAATWLFAWLLWRRLPGFEPFLFCTIVAAVKLATFSLFLARGRDVRWSAARAALLAAIVYALAIPMMERHVPDGDEPFYLLITESVVRDFDLDLANQYRTLATSEVERTDLVPQLNDPTGPHGEQYSRHEPFLALLLVPGYLLGGLHGALATMALFGVLLVRATIRWMEDEGISEEAARAVFPLFAFGPPILFYATRIWPEVPAAFFFVEALRGAREGRGQRWIPALLGLVLLKLRFVLVAVAFVAALRVRRARWIAIAAAIIALPLFVVWLISGSPTNVHSWRELIPTPGPAYATGFFGLLADGMSGIAFQAPFYLLGLAALVRWRAVPRSVRHGVLASALYILYLLPRPEWFGGWAPPLRYVVFLMPVLAVAAAWAWDRFSRGFIAVASLWTAGVVVHGLVYPWRLFHIANGENAIGEWLSFYERADVSRLFPSFIRLNDAAWIGAAVVVVLLFGVRRQSRRVESGSVAAALQIGAFALALGFGFRCALDPGATVHFEDAHVVKQGGRLYPELYTMMRVAYRGGWVLEAGDSVSFLAREGTHTLHAITGLGATFELGGRAYSIGPDARYQAVRVTIPRDGRVTLRCLSGAINLDRMERE